MIAAANQRSLDPIYFLASQNATFCCLADSSLNRLEKIVRHHVALDLGDELKISFARVYPDLAMLVIAQATSLPKVFALAFGRLANCLPILNSDGTNISNLAIAHAVADRFQQVFILAADDQLAVDETGYHRRVVPD